MSHAMPNQGCDIDIPDDLRRLYAEALAKEAAVCHWNDAGAKNSRWTNRQGLHNHSLTNLILRIARLEAVLRAAKNETHS